jgi:hypothetical protein
MKQLNYILENELEVLNFLKSRYPLYHLSNIFFRDIQYGIQTMLDRKNMSVGYADAEKIARAFVAQLEKKKILNPIDRQSWVVNYPEFRKPAAKPAAPARPAAKPAAAAPATPGAARPSLPPLSRPAAGASAKPGGLPPLKSSSPAAATPVPQAAAPTAQAEPEKPATVAQSSPMPAAEVPKPASSPAPKPIAPGERKPLPPLRSSTPAKK